MPAYGSALSPAETTALVRFLETMHPNYQPPSQRCVAARGGAKETAGSGAMMRHCVKEADDVPNAY